MEEKKKGNWNFVLGLALGIILYKVVFDMILPNFIS